MLGVAYLTSLWTLIPVWKNSREGTLRYDDCICTAVDVLSLRLTLVPSRCTLAVIRQSHPQMGTLLVESGIGGNSHIVQVDVGHLRSS